MAGKKRTANYELLRSLAMAMVILLHFLSRSGRLVELDEPLSPERLVGTAVEAFSLMAVNTYVLISGYFGVKSAFKPTKAVALLCRIWFYALLVPAALMLAGMPTAFSDQGVYGALQYLFPIETEHYWFATSYFMLYLLTPALNGAVRGMTQKQLQITLAGLMVLFCGIKSFCPVAFAFDRYGYDLPWFICVYLLAAYLGRFGCSFLEKWGWPLYIGSAAGSFGVNLGMYFLREKGECFRYYFTVPFHYNFVLCLTGALGLFYGFARVSIKEGWLAGVIRRLGALSFGVYLLHEHVDLRGKWYGWLKVLVNPGGNPGMGYFLLELISCTGILFMAGIAIDWLRGRLFQGARRVLGKSPLARELKKLDGYFALK